MAPTPPAPGVGQAPAPSGAAANGLDWAVPASGSPVTLSLEVALDAGGGPVVVNTAGDLLLAAPLTIGSGAEQQGVPALVRRDATGGGLWAYAYGPDARLVAALDDDGSALVAGYFTGALNLPGAELLSFRNPPSVHGSASSLDDAHQRSRLSPDIALLRLTAAGEVAWARRFGDAGVQRAVAIERSVVGEYVVVGEFEAQLVLDELRVTSSGGGSRADVFIARFDGAGRALSLWREEPMNVDAIALAADGSLWIAGRQNDLGSNRVWKLGPDGQRQLTLEVGDESGPSARKLALGPAGSLYVVYDGTEHAPLFGRSIVGSGALVQLSAAGEVAWLQPLNADFALSSIAADAAGNVTVAGTYRSSIDLGAGALPSSGDLDIFVGSFTPAGTLRYSLRLGGPGFDGMNDISARPSGGWLVPFYLGQPLTLGTEQVSAGEHLLRITEH